MTGVDTGSTGRKAARSSKAKTASAEEVARKGTLAKPRGTKASAQRAAEPGSEGGAHIVPVHSGDVGASCTDAQWHAKVAELAYLRAERRGFVDGSPEQDWLEAEEDLRRSLRASTGAGSTPDAS
jgi:hypothetical protein